jgi:glycosyltransferase involved in cell wall biosynthesis
MKKRRIVLASVLKPVDDTRMFEKIARTIVRHLPYNVTIIGYPSRSNPQDSNIQFLPLENFTRLSVRRWWASFRITKMILQLKPDVVIINTHELLFAAVLAKIFSGSKIIYDVQENYWRNIVWTNTFPVLLRPLLATWVRLKELCTAPFFNLFILAERGYEKEMSFFRKNYIVLENKSTLPPDFIRKGSPQKSRLLFSGTLSKETGVLASIALADKLHQIDASVHLTIIGYSSLPSFLDELNSHIEGKSYITLVGGPQLVTHDEIVQQIAHSDFGIIYYDLLPSVVNKTPTKLYEYLHARLPILLQHHPPWVEMCSQYQAAIVVDWPNPDPARLLYQMKSSSFYTIPPQGVDWASEETKLIDALMNF